LKASFIRRLKEGGTYNVLLFGAKLVDDHANEVERRKAATADRSIHISPA